MPLQVAINHLGDPIFRTAIKKYINFQKLILVNRQAIFH